MDRWGLNARFQVPQMITCYWLKPSPGFMMINTDGSLNDGATGFGAIIRDEEGDALTAVVGSSVPKTITYHELQGLEAGLRLTASHNYRNVQVGTDSITVLSYFQQPIDPPWIAIPIMRRICKMIQNLKSFQIQHIYRQTNRAADHLASLYRTSDFLEIVPSAFAEDLKKIVFDDKVGKAYYRCI
ncbi:Ribonuclease H domain [Macleaya cordata]|uniref:Ribonuclease H domain n=1 Tax=Macleaya cordata TaxID=56857 RepID=A0A200PU89_MACCD|nr:Ribonuclease H domain [Macleaya cordata]